MADYAQHVNSSTLDNIKTTSRYDSDISKWVNDSALWHKNSAGILVATGYDNPLPTTVSGSNVLDTAPVAVKTVQKTLTTAVINAVSVAAGGNTGYVSCGVDGSEDEVWIAVNIDKEPWTVFTRNYFAQGSSKSNYPELLAKTTTHSIYPCLSLLIGVNPTEQGLVAPTTLGQAKEMYFPYGGNQVYVSNGHATDAATITVRVIRIWR